MEESENITYDDLVQTKNVQILKSIVPYLELRTQKPMALMIQLMEFQNARKAFSEQNSRLSACSLPGGTDRRSAMLNAVRQYCPPKEQETIDTLINLFCVMENYDLLNNQ